VNVAVIVAVDVIAPVIVAALGNGNDIVAAIDAVNAYATCIRGGRYRRLPEARRRSARDRIRYGSQPDTRATTRGQRGLGRSAAKGSAVIDERIENELYERGVDLLEATNDRPASP
jgi:hypothetical protein